MLVKSLLLLLSLTGSASVAASVVIRRDRRRLYAAGYRDCLRTLAQPSSAAGAD